MIFLRSLILFSILNFVISESLVYNDFKQSNVSQDCPVQTKDFKQKDVFQDCPGPTPQLNNPTTKLFPKNNKISSKSKVTNKNDVLNNLRFNGSKIILTKANPRFAISLFDIKIGTPLTVCLEDLQNFNGPMELFIPEDVNILALTQYILYDSDGVNNSKGQSLSFVKTIDNNYFVYKNTISISGCFTIKNIGDKNEEYAVLFRWKQIHTRYCMGQKNIGIAYILSDDWIKFEATPDGDCEVIILADPSSLLVTKIFSFGYNSEDNIVFKSGLN